MTFTYIFSNILIAVYLTSGIAYLLENYRFLKLLKENILQMINENSIQNDNLKVNLPFLDKLYILLISFVPFVNTYCLIDLLYNEEFLLEDTTAELISNF